MKFFLWFNALGFQAVWWSCIYFHDLLWGLPAVVCASIYIAIHFLLIGKRKKEFILVSKIFGMGLIGEALVSFLGIYTFVSKPLISFMAPLWLIALWIAFACTVNHSLKLVITKPKFSVPVGMVMGPFTYLSGQSLGVLNFNLSIGGIGAFAMIWAVYMSLIHIFQKHA